MRSYFCGRCRNYYSYDYDYERKLEKYINTYGMEVEDGGEGRGNRDGSYGELEDGKEIW